MCFPRDGPTHDARPPQNLLPKWQSSGPPPRRKMPALKTVDWSSASLGTLLTGTRALGICACPETDRLIVLVLRRHSFRNGRITATSVNLKMAAVKSIARLHLLLTASHRHKSTGNMCLPRDGPTHDARPPQNLLPKWQSSGFFSQKENASPDNCIGFLLLLAV